MAKVETRRLSPGTQKKDNDCLTAIQGIPGYKPAKDEYKLTNLEAAAETAEENQQKEKQAGLAAITTRDRATASEWTFHNLILGAKKQIVAQFGENSDEIKCVGLKKKIEYKRGGGRKPKSKVA